MDTLNMGLQEASALRAAVNDNVVPIGTDSSSQFEILKDYIQEFESSLDSEHEVGMLVASFGTSVLLNVTYISYENPTLMVFKGIYQGSEATLIQHVNHLNFLLTSVKKDADRPKHKIGFAIDSEE